MAGTGLWAISGEGYLTKVLRAVGGLVCLPLVAAVDFNDGVFPEVVLSGRALAMGNAFVALVDDESAALYNPAGLGTVRDWHWQMSNLFGEVGTRQARSLTQNFFDLGQVARNSFYLEGLRKNHLKNPGIFTHTRVSMAPNFTRRFLSLGAFYSRRTRSFYGGGTADRFEFADRMDFGSYMGSNISLAGGIFKLGATALWLERKEVIGDADANVGFKATAAQTAKGRMLLTVLGTRLTLPLAGLPALAATWHNFLDQGFRRESGYAQAPDKIAKNLVLALSFTPIIGKRKKAHIEVNYRDAGKRCPELRNSERWMVGVEFNLVNMFFIRGGYRDDLVSGGLGFKLGAFHFDFTTYAGKETIQDSSRRGERRFLFSTSFGF